MLFESSLVLPLPIPVQGLDLRLGSRAIVRYDEHPARLLFVGDEDRATQSLRRTALSRALRASTDVVVDLSALAFADSSLMLDLAMLARRLRGRGRQMLLRSPQPHVLRLIEFAGLARLPGVQVERAPALA